MQKADFKVYTETDFEDLSWHDCNVWRIEFCVGDPEEDDWTSDLVLGIDFITAWLCGVDRMCRFMVAPANLVFHDVMDLSIHIDWDKAELAHEASIHKIERELVDPSEIKQRGWGLNRPHYRWKILFNWPEKGEMTFEASGFTQELLVEPLESEGQSLSKRQRDALLGEKQP